MARSPETRWKEFCWDDECQAVGPEVEAQLAENVEHDRDAVELRLHRDLIRGSDNNEEDAEDSLLDTNIRDVRCLVRNFTHKRNVLETLAIEVVDGEDEPSAAN